MSKILPIQPINVEYYSFQFSGIERSLDVLLNKYKAVYIADEMGLGKTIQAFGIIHSLPIKRVLIICPKFLVPKWKKEISEKLPLPRNYQILITSYSYISNPKNLSMYTRNNYDIVILDEAHYIKNHESNRSSSVLFLPEHAHKKIEDVTKYFVWISGTPLQKVGDIYPFLYSIKHPIIKNQTREEFIQKWSKSFRRLRYNKISYKGVKDPHILKDVLRDCMIRRKKRDVKKDLPSITRDYIPIPISEALAKLEKSYDGIENDISYEEITEFITDIPGFEQYAEFRKKQAEYKIPYVLDFLKKNIIEAEKKFAIFTYHVDIAESYFNELKVSNKILITGNVPPEKRLELIETANKMESCILIMTMSSVKEGLDLDKFSLAFWTEIDWGFLLLDQTEGRFDRIIQKNPMFFYYFIFESGMEQKMFKMFTEKRSDAEKILP